MGGDEFGEFAEFDKFEKRFNATKFAKSNEFNDDIFAKLGFRVEIC